MLFSEVRKVTPSGTLSSASSGQWAGEGLPENHSCCPSPEGSRHRYSQPGSCDCHSEPGYWCLGPLSLPFG